jgi:predicted amidohydrolase YtcJ
MKKILLVLLAASNSLFSFAQKKKADLIVYNAKIYTVDEKFSVANAIAIEGGRIAATGSTASILSGYEAPKKINAAGKTVYPGFIDAHAHFYRYGLGLQTVNLVGTKSWEEIMGKLKTFAQQNGEGWLIGRGWDQNDWTVKEFPTKEKLDEAFPNRPVLLTRVDGHAAIVNQKALDLAGVKVGQTLTGGTVETKNGKLTGILIDNAIDLVSVKIPAATIAQIEKGLLDAQRNCFEVGLTTVDDCGLDFTEVQQIDALQKKGDLKMRIYAMLSDAPHNYNFLFKNGAIKTDYLNVRSFKVYADGALGSRGAVLLQPYADRKDWHGFLLSRPEHFDLVANIIYQNGFQMCTHAIGDSGNRTILNIYGKYLKGKNDLRWRIEHAQVVNAADFKLFGQYNVVPSVQPTHATSDMYWAGQRLGKEREKGAYAYRQLAQQVGWLPLGTDFPVEDISPFKTFYAAVFRMDDKAFPKGGYQPENALTRQQALRGMTIWAAKSNFEEEEKGSLEKGKLADFVLLDTDLMTASPQAVLKTKVVATFVGGLQVHGRPL